VDQEQNPAVIPHLDRLATLQGYGAMLGLFAVIAGVGFMLASPGTVFFPVLIALGVVAAGLALFNRYRFRKAAARLRAESTGTT
jgi:hypothetical protein